MEEELKALENELNDAVNSPPPVTKKMLAFMLKSICGVVKVVVASYSTDTLKVENLRPRVWEVVGRCERAGIFVLAMVADGASVNHAFSGSKIVFSSWNPFIPDRPIFFLNDVPYL